MSLPTLSARLEFRKYFKRKARPHGLYASLGKLTAETVVSLIKPRCLNTCAQTRRFFVLNERAPGGRSQAEGLLDLRDGSTGFAFEQFAQLLPACEPGARGFKCLRVVSLAGLGGHRSSPLCGQWPIPRPSPSGARKSRASWRVRMLPLQHAQKSSRFCKIRPIRACSSRLIRAWVKSPSRNRAKLNPRTSDN